MANENIGEMLKKVFGFHHMQNNAKISDSILYWGLNKYKGKMLHADAYFPPSESEKPRGNQLYISPGKTLDFLLETGNLFPEFLGITKCKFQNCGNSNLEQSPIGQIIKVKLCLAIDTYFERDRTAGLILHAKAKYEDKKSAYGYRETTFMTINYPVIIPPNTDIPLPQV